MENIEIETEKREQPLRGIQNLIIKNRKVKSQAMSDWMSGGQICCRNTRGSLQHKISTNIASLVTTPTTKRRKVH